MRNILLTLATTAALIVGSFAVPTQADARPVRYRTYYVYPNRPYYRPFVYTYPRTYYSGYPAYQYEYPRYYYAPGVYIGGPRVGVYYRY